MSTYISYALEVAQGLAEANGLTFFHGTVKMVNNDLVALGTIASSVPMCFAVEVMSSRLVLDKSSAIGQYPEYRLLILNSCKFEDWRTADHYTNVIQPMEVKAEALINAFKNSPLVAGNLFTEARITNHVNAGSYTEKGHDANLFAHHFSGVELRLSPPLLKHCDCC